MDFEVKRVATWQHKPESEVWGWDSVVCVPELPPTQFPYCNPDLEGGTTEEYVVIQWGGGVRQSFLKKDLHINGKFNYSNSKIPYAKEATSMTKHKTNTNENGASPDGRVRHSHHFSSPGLLPGHRTTPPVCQLPWCGGSSHRRTRRTYNYTQPCTGVLRGRGGRRKKGGRSATDVSLGGIFFC